jgi:hypothetical protein
LKLRPTAVLYADSAGVALSVPQGVGCGGGAFVVADSGGGRVLRFEVSGAMARSTAAYAVKEIPYPVRADQAKDGSLVVLDGKSRRIGRIHADGSFGGWIAIPAVEGTAAPAIVSFALASSGSVFALDLAGRRVVVVGTAGAVERTIPLPQEARYPADVTLGPHDAAYVVDGVARQVFVARAEDKEFVPFSKSLVEDLDFPGAIASDGAGHLFVADQDGGGVVILGPDGSFRGRQAAFGWKEGYLRYPSGICSNGRGVVIVADRENQRVDVFSVGQ